jgi:hypothetical protein
MPSLSADDDSFKMIRFYKLNKNEQQNRLLIREGRLKKVGCQNFSTKPRVYRLTQIGFKYCYIYSKKDCEAGTEIMGSWKGEKQDNKFTQGGEWLFNKANLRGEKAKSWHCHS